MSRDVTPPRVRQVAHAIADLGRISLLRALAAHPRGLPVTKLATLTGRSGASVSTNLRVLRQAGLVGYAVSRGVADRRLHLYKLLKGGLRVLRRFLVSLRHPNDPPKHPAQAMPRDAA